MFAFVPPYAAAQDAPEGADAQSEQVAPDAAPAEDAASDEAETEEPAAAPGEEDAAEDAEKPAGPWNVANPCENAQHPYQAELCQDWRVAQASERTADLTRLLMLLALLATFLLLAMFIPLLMAVRAARQGSQGRSGPVLARSGDQEDELRAYVDVDTLDFIDTPESEGVVKVKITYRNSGQTPAFNVESKAEMGVKDISDEGLLPVVPLPDRSALDALRSRLGRDATATTLVQCDSAPKLAERVTNGEATILVWGLVTYTDVFDCRRRTAFQFLCNAETLDSGQIFKPMVRGDEDG